MISVTGRQRTTSDNPLRDPSTSGSRYRSFVTGFLLLILLFFAGNMLFGQDVTAVFIHTSDVSSEVLMLAETYQKKRYRNQDLLNSHLQEIIYELKSEGHLSASIDSTVVQNDTTFIYLFAGHRYTRSILLLDDDDMQIAVTAGFRAEDLLGEYLLPGPTLRQITDYLNQRGFPFAEVLVEEVKLDGDTIYTRASIEQGKYYEWDTLEIKGDISINNAVMQKLLRIRKGQPFNNTLLPDIDSHIGSLAFVKPSKGYSLVLTEDGKARVLLNLEKEKASGFNGILGFGPDKDDPGKLIFSGDVALKLINAFAQAEEIGMKWTGIQGDQQLFLSYSQPYLPSLPFGVVYNFDLFKNGELYYTLNQRGGIMIRSGPGTMITTYLQRKSSKVLDRSIYSSYSVLPPWTDYSTTLFGLAYKFHRIDFPGNPGRGIIFSGDIAGGQKRIQEASDIPSTMFTGIELSQRQVHGHLLFEAFLPLTERWIIRSAGQSSWIFAKTTHENELFLIGGINSIRGFDERSISASALAVASLELRYRFEMESHLKLFLDVGWYEKRLQSSYINDIPYGFGLGMSIPSPAGVLQISYAYGIQQGNPLDLRTGRLHLGLVSMF